MPVTNIYTVNGAIIGESTGGVRTDYLTDALGNVTATLGVNGQVVNTYRYKPYGGLLAKTGVGADPSFQWVGAHGYHPTSKKFSDVYIRARHYDMATGRWTTKDQSVAEGVLALFRYVWSNPISNVDPSGRLTISARSGWNTGTSPKLPQFPQSCCGEYAAPWKIQLSRIHPESGYIAQLVTVTIITTNCRG